MCQHQTRRVQRQSDGDAFFQIYSGGMHAAEPSDNTWHIEPILDDGHPCAKGFMPTAKLQAFFRQHGFTFIAFHRIGWFKGNYHSSWSPFIPGQTNHLQGPADLWSNVASNLSRARTASDLAALVQPTHEQIATLLDNRSEAERLASSISLSLRNMDISVEQIAEFYNEQLVNHMASGSLEGKRASSTLDQTLFAHVHSFFMHLGAARDYLAAFCAQDGQRPAEGRLIRTAYGSSPARAFFYGRSSPTAPSERLLSAKADQFRQIRTGWLDGRSHRLAERIHAPTTLWRPLH